MRKPPHLLGHFPDVFRVRGLPLISSLLFDVSPVDPLTYGIVSLTLIAATVLANYVPALRASAVDLIEAIRSE